MTDEKKDDFDQQRDILLKKLYLYIEKYSDLVADPGTTPLETDRDDAIQRLNALSSALTAVAIHPR